MIFTSISPNTQSDDVLRALKMLVTPWRWRRGEFVDELEKEFENYFPGFKATSFQSGRNSLYAILKSLNLHKGDEVLLQSYTCVAVPEPVLWLDLKPVYVDCLSNLTMNPEDLKAKLTPKSKVLIIQHTFGTSAHIDELVAVAKAHNIFVIEDCAHALGGMYKDKKLGTLGDAAFFSFGRDKIISSVFGGMATTKNAKLSQDGFSAPASLYVFQQLMHPVLMTVAKSLYGSGLGKIIIAAGRVLGLISKAVEKPELSGDKPSFFAQTLPNGLAYLALHQFKKLASYNEHRKKIAAFYSENIHTNKVTLPLFDSIFLRYPVFTQEPRELIMKAKQKGIELGDWYSVAIAPRGVDYAKIGYNPTDCPTAEKIAKQTVNLPTHIGITQEKAFAIIEFINTL